MPKQSVVALVSLFLCSAVFDTTLAYCGDGIRGAGEQCDDGNTIIGDGCSAACSCEQDPCAFVAGASVNLASVISGLLPGDTLTLQGGTYAARGSCGWIIASVHDGADPRPITIRGAPSGAPVTVIDCDSAGPVVEGVVIGTHLRLMDIHFTNAHRSGSGGGALRAERSRVVIENCRFSKSSSDQEGGALLVSNSSLLIARSHFEENDAEHGGALAIVNGAEAILRSSTFTRCYAAVRGGAIYVAGRSHATMAGMLISFNDAMVTGGGVCIWQSTANISSTVFSNNTAVFTGGAMDVTGTIISSVVRITGGVSILGNYAAYGGGIRVGEHARRHACFIDSTDGPVEVFENSAILGGGLWLYFHSHHVASGDVSFRNNWGSLACGGLGSWVGGIIELYDGVRIQDNGAQSAGGGLFHVGMTDDGVGFVFASGNVMLEENYVTTPVETGFGFDGSGGGYWPGYGSSTFMFGVVFKNNRAAANGGGFADYIVSPLVPIGGTMIVMENVVFTGNTATLDGGGVYVKDKFVDFSHLLLLNNTAHRSAGGIACDGGTVAAMRTCSFIENKALSVCEGTQACGVGGALGVFGKDTVVHVTETVLEGNSAGNEGGGVYVAGSASLTMNKTRVSACKARYNGGGISTRQNSRVTLSDDVAIQNCEALHGKGGGMLVAGISLSVRMTGTGDSTLLIENNRARSGGGISFMGIVKLEAGSSKTVIQGNTAEDSGGGLHGFSSFAKISVELDHELVVQANSAFDGAGIALVRGAHMYVATPDCDSTCIPSMRGNGRCNLECMSSGCNWDDSDCNHLFSDAGKAASKPCDCSFSSFIPPRPWLCAPAHPAITNGYTLCFTASCDWDPYNPLCSGPKQQLGKCPLFDAITHESLLSVEGLRYVKDGKGFTTPYLMDAVLGVPFPHPQGSAGRCLNARCRTDAPPMTGVNTLEPGESWCDSFPDWGGSVLQNTRPDNNCCEGDKDWEGTYSCSDQCTDLGKAWGVCSDKVKLPSAGFDYDAQVLEQIRLMTIPALFEAYPSCGRMPLVVRDNHASRHGGGLYQDGCDMGLEEKELCWVGGTAVQASASFALSFEGNSANGAGGAIFSACHSLGICKDVLKLTIGLPTKTTGTVVSFLSNQAAGYGHDIATAPNELVLSNHTTDSHYVPGKTKLSMDVSIRDSQGQVVMGKDDTPISYQVLVLVLPVYADCSTFASCEIQKLQATESFLSHGTEGTTRLVDHDIRLQYCQAGEEYVKIKLFLTPGKDLDAPPEWAMLQKAVIGTCSPCVPGWTRLEVDGRLGKRLWTCTPCEKNQYVIDPMKHTCQQCPAGGSCEEGAFRPTNPADSIWNSTSDGVLRITSCPAGHVLIRDEAAPASDRCVACAPDTYSVEEAVFGEKLWDLSVENYNQYCHPCPRSRAMCSGANDVRPLAGYWSPESSRLSSSDAGNTHRRQENGTTAGVANRGRTVLLYRCIPPTACLEGNASYPNGLCMPGAYGPLCGICNETDGYAKSKDGCRKCDTSGASQSTSEIAVWTGIMGVPIFLTFWYFFALRPLVTRGVDEDEEQDRPENASPAWNGFKARLFFCLGRASEHPIWLKTMAPVIGPARALISNCITYGLKNNPKDYIKIIVSFYQVSNSFSSNVDVKWPESVTSVWKLFAFLTMEIFKLYGYDCMFGGIDYLGRLALVTTVPVLVVFVFIVPWLASFFYQKHRRSRVFDTCANSVMWVIYLIYPLLCLMTIQGFKCVDVEKMHLLAADMKEPCPWKEGERGSWIFVWSAASMVLYPIGIPVILLACLLYLDLPRLARHGKGEAIFQQLIGLYIKQRDESVCSRIATYVGGSKDETQPQVDLTERAAQLHREVSGNGEHAVTSERFMNFMEKDVTDDDREEMAQIFAHFDDDGNGALDEEEMLALLTFLIDANSRIHVGLTLRTIKTMDVKTMANHFLVDEGRERAQSSGLTRFFLKQLKQEADAVPVQRRASLMESSSFRSRGSSSRQSPCSLADAEQVADTDVTEKDKIIDSLLDKGRKMIRQGAFALPKLAWNTNQAHPEEKRVLQMIGFLLDAYHKDTWWWELFEMWRKFMLAGAIILIPTEGGKQIAFALLISTICLYTSLRTSPYIVENLLKLHIMSLTAQCITLFYALLLEIQDLSSVAEVCVDGKDCGQQSISDAIMESLLSLLQVSVFLLPIGLLVRDRGVFNAVGKAINHVIDETCKCVRVSMGHTTEETKKVRWPSILTKEECGSSIPVRSQKKGRNQAPGMIYSSRKLRTARGVTPQDVRQLRTTDDIQPIEVECSTQAEVIQEPRPQRTAAVLPTTEVQSSKQVLLSTMLSRFDLQDDVEDLAKSGIRKRSDLAYLDQNFIKNLPDLTPLCKRKLEKLIASCASAKSSSPGDDWSHEEGEAVRLFSHIPFSRRFSPEPNSVVQNFIGLNRDVEGSAVVDPGDLRPVTASNDISAFADALCGNGCFGADAQVSHWCRECDKAICSPCVYMHSRQPQTVSHALTEITSVVREREVLEEKLARVQETSVEQTRRITAEEEEIEREKQELATQFKAEEESRQRELEQIQAAAVERKAEEQRRMRALEEESARLKAAAEQEAECRKGEKDEILLQKQQLEEALARVHAHSFRSVKLSSAPPGTKDSLVQDMTPISCASGASPAAASAFTPAPRSSGIGTSERAVDLSPATSAQAGARERLKAARELFDEGLIDESDFKKAKADIVSTLSQVFV